jgi:pyruvate dehydrogenase E1 component subunit alpha
MTLDDSRLPEMSEAELLRLLEGMVRIRVTDTRLLNMQRQGRIGFYGTATGEEASVIGSFAGVRDTDWVLPALRQGGGLIHRGFPLSLHVAQCIGNSMDVLKGRQMPVHAASRKYNVVSWSSVIGTQLTHAVGAAMAAKKKGDDTIVLAFLGDGATSSAEFHVALNFAAVYAAPVVFLCQNNQWAISVPVRRQTVSAGIAEKAVAYGMPGERVDGNDVLVVMGAVREAAERARNGGGPTLVECLTYRQMGHSSSDDPTRYREDEEVEEWAKKDPIDRFAAYLIQKKLLTPADMPAMEARIGKEVAEAIREAEAAPPLTAEDVFTDVYADVPWNLAEQAEAVKGRTAGDRDWDGAFPL